MYHLQTQMLSTVWLELQKWLMLHCLARRWIDQHSLLLELLRDSFIFQTWKHDASCRSCQFVDLCHSLGQIFSPDFVRPFICFKNKQPSASYDGGNMKKISTGAVRSLLPDLTEEKLKAIRMPKKIEL
jgi:hypothetical protein